MTSTLLKKLKITGKNITAEGNSVVASPGELSRAPFIQTLYAGQSTLECLIITPFKFSDLYAGGGTPAKKIKARQTIYFGTPGSGKSFEVKSLVKTNDKKVLNIFLVIKKIRFIFANVN